MYRCRLAAKIFTEKYILEAHLVGGLGAKPSKGPRAKYSNVVC